MEIEDAKVKTLSKALKVLGCFSSGTPELGITQISKLLDLNKSNVSNIVATFEQEDYLEKNPQTGRYRLGLKLLEFSYIINEKLGYQRMFHDIMQGVSKELNAIVYFGICRNQEVLYLCNSYPPDVGFNYPFRSIIGERAPLYCTSLGKSILAHFPREEAEAYYSKPRPAYTDHTITDEAALREEMAITRERGYGVDNEEHEYGIRCVSVPMFNTDNTLLGALSASSPAFDLKNQNEVMETVRQLKKAAYIMHERM